MSVLPRNFRKSQARKTNKFFWEVISNRTPVILSRQCGVSEILNHVLKVDFWDIEEIANKIISVIRYRCLHDDLVNESGKELVNISWDKAAEKCIGIYNQFV